MLVFTTSRAEVRRLPLKPQPVAGFYAGTIRTADDPDSVLLSFVQGSYEAAAELGKWDRVALERGGGR